ncbi:MAG: hypothetical protein ACYTFY_17580 [Planctomycetota bacterium]|jgi:hypothetical protein
MLENSIVEEVRKNRREILESYTWNIADMMKGMKKKQWENNHEVVTLERKNVRQNVYSPPKK